MKQLARSWDEYQNMAAEKQDRTVYQNRQAGDKFKTEKMDHDSQSVNCELKFEDSQFDEISREYHLRELKYLLSSDPVLKAIKPKLTGSLRGPISAPKPTPNVLEALRRLINLITEAGFTDGTFNAQTLLECNHSRVIAAGKSLFK